MLRRFGLACLGSCLLLGFSTDLRAEDATKHPDAALLGDAAKDLNFQTQGEYVGGEGDKKFGAQVIARGDGKYDVVLLQGGLPGAGWDGKDKVSLSGKTHDAVVDLMGGKWTGKIEKDVLTATGAASVELKKTYRVSPSMGAKPPEGAIVLFDGTNVDAWEGAKLEDGKLLGVGGRTKEKFRDFVLHLEFRSPFMPKASGQGRGNSGMYLLDQYECQILDSFGLSGENNECGGFYTIQKPNVNMCLPPLSWQTYDVDFTAAKFDDAGKKTHKAVVTIKHNGVLIHDKLELDRNTPGGGINDESKPGALFLQNHGDAVRFRNIWIVKK
jgi:hypothetical protein